MLRAFKWPFLMTGLIALAACDPAFPSLAGGDELRKAETAALARRLSQVGVEVTVDRPFEQVFDDIAIIAVSNSYSIIELDEESGLIQLGFGGRSFIDCPRRDGRLKGRMIVQVEAKPDGRTQVKLRAHYSYTATVSGRSLTWTFRTGELRTRTVNFPMAPTGRGGFLVEWQMPLLLRSRFAVGPPTLPSAQFWKGSKNRTPWKVLRSPKS